MPLVTHLLTLGIRHTKHTLGDKHTNTQGKQCLRLNCNWCGQSCDLGQGHDHTQTGHNHAKNGPGGRQRCSSILIVMRFNTMRLLPSDMYMHWIKLKVTMWWYAETHPVYATCKLSLNWWSFTTRVPFWSCPFVGTKQAPTGKSNRGSDSTNFCHFNLLVN